MVNFPSDSFQFDLRSSSELRGRAKSNVSQGVKLINNTTLIENSSPTSGNVHNLWGMIKLNGKAYSV
jgi:hypothetical protein